MRSSKSRSRNEANRPRTLGNIINRVFDSSGPEGKVRGTPQQIIEKYQILARDAQLSNDRVAAENFLQHAEHYTRMLGEAQREMAAEQETRRFEGGQPRQDGNGWNQQPGYGGTGQPRDYRDDPRDEQPRQEYRRDDRGDQPRQDNRDQPRQDNRDQRQDSRRDDQRQDTRGENRPERRDDQRGERRQDQPRQEQPRQEQPRQDREPRQDNRDRRDRPDYRDRRDNRDQRRDAQVPPAAAVIDLDGDDDTGLVETPEAMVPVTVAVPVVAPVPEVVMPVPAAEPAAEAPEAAAKPARKPRAPRKPKAADGDTDDTKAAAE